MKGYRTTHLDHTLGDVTKVLRRQNVIVGHHVQTGDHSKHWPALAPLPRIQAPACILLLPGG